MKTEALLIAQEPGYADVVRNLPTDAKDGVFDIHWVGMLSGGIASLSSGGIDAILLNLDPAVERLSFLGEGRGQLLWRSFSASLTG